MCESHVCLFPFPAHLTTVFKIRYVLNWGLTPRALPRIFTACWLKAFIFFFFFFEQKGGDRENWIEVLAAVKDFVINSCIFLFLIALSKSAP